MFVTVSSKTTQFKKGKSLFYLQNLKYNSCNANSGTDGMHFLVFVIVLKMY